MQQLIVWFDVTFQSGGLLVPLLRIAGVLVGMQAIQILVERCFAFVGSSMAVPVAVAVVIHCQL